MKKIRILTMICLLIFCCFSLSAAAEVISGICGEKLTWKLDTNAGELTISGEGAMYNYKNTNNEFAPWYPNRSSIQSVVIEKGVTRIGHYAFYNCSDMKKVTIPDGVMSIGDAAFGACSNLLSVIIPGSVTSIGYQSFFYCTSLESITIPGSVTSIGNDAFNNCTSMTRVTIQDSTAGKERYIFNSAFINCTALKSVTIGSGVTSIGMLAFIQCTSLESITIPGSVTSIGVFAFRSCDGLQDIYYCGTQAEWNAIKKGEDWDDYTPSDKTIHVFTFTEGNGTKEKPYIIHTDEDWNCLANFIADYSCDTTGKHFKLNESISITTMVGTKTNPFKGIFDGNGNTLSFSFTNSDNEAPAAPFAYISSATIKNLHTTGTIPGDYNRVSGLTGENAGVSLVENCRVSTELSGTKLIGGFCIGTGGAGEGISFEGCVFDGKITGNEQFGGFVAWLGKNSNLQLTNCVSASRVSSDKQKSGTFYYHDPKLAAGATATLTNCYSLTALKNAQGIQAYTIKGQGVDIDYGTSKKNYTVSGITVYATRIKYDDKYCAVEGDEFILNPNPKPKDTEYVQYFGDDNKPLARGTGTTWLMPGENVTISAEIKKAIEPYGTPTFTLPKGTKTIGKNAFEGIKAEIVYVPDEVQSIGAYAFGNFTNLKQIRLPKDCAIDDAAFWGCLNLDAIYTSGDGTTKDWANKNGFGYMKETSQSGN